MESKDGGEGSPRGPTGYVGEGFAEVRQECVIKAVLHVLYT